MLELGSEGRWCLCVVCLSWWWCHPLWTITVSPVDWRHSLWDKLLNAIFFDGAHVWVLYIVLWGSPHCLVASLLLLPRLMSPPYLLAADFSFPSNQSSCPRCWLDDSLPCNFHDVHWTHGALTHNNCGNSKQNSFISELTCLPGSCFLFTQIVESSL